MKNFSRHITVKNKEIRKEMAFFPMSQKYYTRQNIARVVNPSLFLFISFLFLFLCKFPGRRVFDCDLSINAVGQIFILH